MRRVINQRPGRAGNVFLAILPFAILAAVYVTASGVRLAANPDDKLLPSASTIIDTVTRLATEPNRRSGELLFWADTAASLIRLSLGVTIAAGMGVLVGMVNGMVPYARATFSPLIAVVSLVPPLAILPILFIVFGLGEVSKVVLIIIGITPFIMRDLAFAVEGLPGEQLIKAQTLGASSWQIAIRVVLPQVFPRLLDSLRLALGPAWLFLISAEAIAATEGLGYRIFLMRRYLAMDVILPYVVWITLLAFLIDIVLEQLSKRAFGWAREARR